MRAIVSTKQTLLIKEGLDLKKGKDNSGFVKNDTSVLACLEEIKFCRSLVFYDIFRSFNLYKFRALMVQPNGFSSANFFFSEHSSILP